MTTFSNPPRSSKGVVVLLDPATGMPRIISLQYNPDTLTRPLQPQSFKGGSDRWEVLGLSGRPIEAIMEVEFTK